MPIEHISDTARWVAMYRAMESDRPDAIFRDPYARRLAGDRGEAILDQLPRGRANAWPMIVRTAVFDEIILDLIVRERADVVVNLAAGLDTRPWRLTLPATLTWIDVDLPAILEYKADVMRAERPVCRYEVLSKDLTDAAQRAEAFARANAIGSRALVVTEGLLIYLTADHVRGLATDLHAQPHLRWWLFDLASPRLLKMISRQWGKPMQRGNAPFQFGPAEGTDFFRPAGWRQLTFRSTWEEAHRLKREMRGAWVWHLLSTIMPASRREEYRRMSGIVVMERDGQ